MLNEVSWNIAWKICDNFTRHRRIGFSWIIIIIVIRKKRGGDLKLCMKLWIRDDMHGRLVVKNINESLDDRFFRSKCLSVTCFSALNFFLIFFFLFYFYSSFCVTNVFLLAAVLGSYNHLPCQQIVQAFTKKLTFLFLFLQKFLSF